MIHLALQDLRHDLLTFGFSVLGTGVLVFAFLLLIPLSLAVTRIGEAGGLPQNLILIERDALQPEQSRIAPSLAESVSAILGDRLDRVDPVIFRIMRVEEPSDPAARRRLRVVGDYVSPAAPRRSMAIQLL